MSFTKGFWVTIIILTLNRLQDTQRTPWAGSRAERGDKAPAADASPTTLLSNMSLSSRPRQPDQTQQENAWVFWTAEYKNASWSCQKALSSLWMPRERRDAGEAPQSADSATSIHPAPAPTQRPQLQLSPRLPRRQKLKTRFHWSAAWISWIPLLPAFSAFPGVSTVRAGRKGMGRAMGKAAILRAPSDHASPKTDPRHLQRGCHTDYS